MNTTRMDELITQARIPTHDISQGDLHELIRLTVEDCLDACNHVAAEADSTATSKFVTDAGKTLYQGMWGGAMNSAALIRQHYGIE